MALLLDNLRALLMMTRDREFLGDEGRDFFQACIIVMEKCETLATNILIHFINTAVMIDMIKKFFESLEIV